MPITKSRLSKVEKAQYLAALEELRAGGCDVEIPTSWLGDSRAPDIEVRCDGPTVAVADPCGGAFYEIHARLVARKPYLILCDCYAETEWDDEIFFEEFPLRRSISRSMCLQSRAELLNDKIENFLRFTHRGQMAEGVFLFYGFRSIPEQYSHGMFAPFTLIFLDQFAQEIAKKVKVFVDRTAERRAAVARASSSLETAERSVRLSTLFDGGAPPDWAVEALTAHSPDKTACSLKEGAERFGRSEERMQRGACNPLDRGCG